VRRESNAQVHAAETQIDAHAKRDQGVWRLESVPGKGPITALSFAATLDPT
jgi:transposase